MSERLLALETATECCSAALWVDGAVLTRVHHEANAQAEHILPMIEALLAEAGLGRGQIDAVAFGRGPGSFTGLRIAAAVTQGIALAWDRPVLPVSTLAALAAGAWRLHGATRVLTALDARMGEIYWGGWALAAPDGLPRAEVLLEERVTPPAAVRLPAGDGVAVGNGWPLCSGLALDWRPEPAWPLAEDVLRLAVPAHRAGAGLGPEAAQPVYLRDKVAKTRAERAG
ncbi:MAG: tRNA (adenosine(37)-N6)-threonylcarbamoyltransferase complex dimerization subunit type 1 TsaB [Gammaproteobacteria bacterium]|nr:MAG: tRNA (adenosine(37)-N6)-threonylcarbamoyltransferase complex dimerization subunit type 1 TsaB [Gammaproteobacteria bacterium]